MPFSDNDCESQESHALILALHLQVHSFAQEQMGAPAMMTQTPTEICALLDKALMLNTVVFPLTVLCCPVLCDPSPQAVSLLSCTVALTPVLAFVTLPGYEGISEAQCVSEDMVSNGTDENGFFQNSAFDHCLNHIPSIYTDT